MDPLQERLTRIGLEVVGGRGFVLGGGHAIGLHGMGTRPSEDIDLFSSVRGTPAAVADDLIGAYRREGSWPSRSASAPATWCRWR